MVTWDELLERKDSDAILIKVMFACLINFNEHKPISPKFLFECYRDVALTQE